MSDDTRAGESTPFFMSSLVLHSCFSCQCVPSSLQRKKTAGLLNSMRNICISTPAHLLLYSVKSKSVPPHNWGQNCLRQNTKQLLWDIFKCLGLKNFFNIICRLNKRDFRSKEYCVKPDWLLQWSRSAPESQTL